MKVNDKTFKTKKFEFLPSFIECYVQRMKNIPECYLRDVRCTHNKTSEIESLLPPTLDGVWVLTIQSVLIGCHAKELEYLYFLFLQF